MSAAARARVRLTRHAALLLLMASLAVLTLAASACGGTGEPARVVPPAERGSAPATAPADGSGTSTAPPAPAPEGVALDRLQLKLVRVVTGLDSPLWVTGAGDGSGRLFVLEQPGRIRVVSDGTLQKRPYLDLAKRIDAGGERGLLGLAFAPDFDTSGRFYVDYTDLNGDTNIVRFTVDPRASTAQVKGEDLILKIEQPYSNHNGGCIAFGPDGMLYIGMGDGGSGGDPQNRAQNPASPLGKLLRLDVSGTAYSAPRDNPYPTKPYPQNVIWASGLRNPWRFSFDAQGGNLWIADVGQNEIEEVDVVETSRAGVNYGWNLWEGTKPFKTTSPRADRAGMVFPIVQYTHDKGQSITGGYVYRGSDYPPLRGTYLYADFAAGWIAGVRATTASGGGSGWETLDLLDTSLNVSSFGEDDRRELYVCDLNGAVYRVTASAK